MSCPVGESSQEKRVQLWEIQLYIPACIVLLDTTEAAGSVRVWSTKLKQSFVKTLGKRPSVAQCLFFDVTWIKL